MDEDKTLRKPMDVDKTMRKPSTNDSDVEKTMRQPSTNDADVDKTMRKPTEDVDKTLRKDSFDTAKNSGVDGDKTIAINKSPKNPQPDLSQQSQPEVYSLNGINYNFKKIISESTGEAQIYLVENNGNDYVLKLYYPQFTPKDELMEILKSFDYPGIVKLYDYGVWTGPSGTRRSFELMELLRGGTLEDVRFIRDAAKLRDIAMQAAGALTFCHNNRILHKDIKPGNFFFRDTDHKQLVLGDFGIASLCAEDELMHQTQQARTPIYAAPELYDTIDEKVEIDGKVDFYSLGILLMYIWLGANPFKDKERTMVRMKRFGELPFPEDMPQDLLMLVQGLTIVDSRKRWGFDEVQRWYKGELVPVAKNTAARYTPYKFDADKSLIANTPEELARLMETDPELSIKYLYSKRITKWLEDAGNMKLAVLLEEIIEKRYPKNQKAGLHAAIYFLDESIIYKDVDGNECDTFEKMAAAFVKNQAHYEKVLSNPDDDFYLYLEASGNTKERDLFLKYFKNSEPKIALWRAIYYLDESTPFWLGIAPSKNKKTFMQCATPDDIIVAFRQNNLSDEGWDSFIDGRFQSWFATQNDPDTYGIIDKLIKDDGLSHSEKVHGMMFYMNRNVSFNMYLPGEDDDQYYFTREDIGNLFNHYARQKFQEKQNNGYLDMCIDRLVANKSVMYLYFQSKGWNKDIDWVKYCFELNKGDNRKKAGPYNKEIAMYKAIKGLGFDPYYHFKKADKYVYTLEELAEIPKDEIIAELENGVLKSWLTVFYQENPFADLKLEYAYENLTRQYTDKLQELNKKNPEAATFYQTIGMIEKMKNKVKRRYSTLSVMRILFGILFLIPAVLLIAGLIIYKIPLNENPLPGAFWKVTSAYYLFVGIPLGIITWVSGDGVGFISGIIAGFIEAVIIYYVVYFVVALLYPILTIISIVLAVLGMVGFAWAAYGPLSSSKSLRKEILSKSDIQSTLIEPLYNAYHPNKSGFKSSQTDALNNFYDDMKRQRTKLISWILPGIIVFVFLLGTFFMLHPVFAENTIRKSLLVKAGLVMSDAQKAQIPGQWEGMFDDRSSILTIDSLYSDSIRGNIQVKYKRNVQEAFAGVFDFKEKTLSFKDLVQNEKLDGKYDADITETLDTIRGTYKSVTGKRVKFEYVKVQQPAN